MHSYITSISSESYNNSMSSESIVVNSDRYLLLMMMVAVPTVLGLAFWYLHTIYINLPKKEKKKKKKEKKKELPSSSRGSVDEKEAFIEDSTALRGDGFFGPGEEEEVSTGETDTSSDEEEDDDVMCADFTTATTTNEKDVDSPLPFPTSSPHQPRRNQTKPTKIPRLDLSSIAVSVARANNERGGGGMWGKYPTESVSVSFFTNAT